MGHTRGRFLGSHGPGFCVVREGRWQEGVYATTKEALAVCTGPEPQQGYPGKVPRGGYLHSSLWGNWTQLEDEGPLPLTTFSRGDHSAQPSLAQQLQAPALGWLCLPRGLTQSAHCLLCPLINCMEICSPLLLPGQMNFRRKLCTVHGQEIPVASLSGSDLGMETEHNCFSNHRACSTRKPGPPHSQRKAGTVGAPGAPLWERDSKGPASPCSVGGRAGKACDRCPLAASSMLGNVRAPEALSCGHRPAGQQLPQCHTNTRPLSSASCISPQATEERGSGTVFSPGLCFPSRC